MTTNINADDGVVSGVAGLKTSADNSGVLALQTNGTTAVTIDTSQNVGIGVTPSAWATFKALQNGGTSVADFGGANNAYFGSNAYFDGTVYRYIATAGASSYRQVSRQHQWFTAASGTAGDAISFTQVLSVQEGKSLSLQGATSQTGVGITFPATQSASSDANTLDDYEEGTWTPVVTSTGGTYANASGRYTKIGRVVVCDFFLQNGSSFTYASTSAAWTITGLPFTPSGFSYSGPTGSVWTQTLNYNNDQGASVKLVTPTATTSATILFRTSDSAAASGYIKNENNSAFIVTGQVVYSV